MHYFKKVSIRFKRRRTNKVSYEYNTFKFISLWGRTVYDLRACRYIRSDAHSSSLPTLANYNFRNLYTPLIPFLSMELWMSATSNLNSPHADTRFFFFFLKFLVLDRGLPPECQCSTKLNQTHFISAWHVISMLKIHRRHAIHRSTSTYINQDRRSWTGNILTSLF